MKKISMIIGLVLSAAGLRAQEDVFIFNNLYFGFEVGKSPAYKTASIGTMWLQLDRNYFKIKIASADNPPIKEEKEKFAAYHKDCDCVQKNEGISDMSLIYGRSYRIFRNHQLQFGAGISFFNKTVPNDVFNAKKQDYEPAQFKEKYTVGLPAEIRYAFQFKRYVALKATLGANVNSLKSYHAASAGVAIGLF
jgi:hypothetical protein